ncbi:MAG TPA: ATP-binding cassette domain-containing protein [Acidimicrobiales bacterium]|nr:ATP-binding cassette domain-containing protein [Acidimicrobiales bacterium]
MAVIRVDRLTKRFGPVVAVDDLSFEVEAGTVTGFLGPNGAGKTTTLRSLLGLVVPTSGAATVLGQPYRELDDPIRRVGAVLEASDFHPGRRAGDHLRVAAAAAGLPAARVGDALTQVGLQAVADRRVGGFSLGMRQRLALAGALLGAPEVLVLDEPANGLDPEGMHWLRGFLRAFAARGGTVLISSHVLAEVAQTVDRVVIVSAGRLVAAATLDELVRRSAGEVRVRSQEAERLRDVLLARGVVARLAEPELVVAAGVTAHAVGQAAADSRIAVYEMTSDRADLEAVFLELTGSREGQP